ncbi:MAG: D-alanyl-D-alanine carboxypeptidase [Oscillospiraceae bacterium]|jgi:D-alanyl-D-alanine carboxypeptidase/D-alanyl-D-alanine carboxypeptidase (penicillin-binding protein 5/6)|nr:D-alanyl-D-alanine carboxypeptidase [Oscillospiraceae bacterium]
MRKILICLITAAILTVSVSGEMPEDFTASAKACVLIEAATGEIIYASNADVKMRIASTTKIMTTLLTIESGELDESFTVDPDAIKVEGSSMGLQEGDTVTKRALCYGMMLPSGNDAANASAIKISGSYEKFSELMNDRAKAIGMTRSYFVTPSGLEEDPSDTVKSGASAYDMALLTREAMRNETFREICSQQRAMVTFGNPPYDRWLNNTNKLLSMCDGVIGVKTGFTDEAGRCLVSACKRDGIELICVTLNAPSDWEDHTAMYKRGFAELTLSEMPVTEKYFIDVAGADSIELFPMDTVKYGKLPNCSEEITVRLIAPPFLYMPVGNNESVAQLEFYYNGRYVDTIEMTVGS